MSAPSNASSSFNVLCRRDGSLLSFAQADALETMSLTRCRSSRPPVTSDTPSFLTCDSLLRSRYFSLSPIVFPSK